MRSTRLIAVFVLVASVSGIFGATGPSAAAGTRSVDSTAQCTPQQFCLWTGTNYTGTFGMWDRSAARLPAALNKKVGSVWSRMPGAVYFYSAPDWEPADSPLFCLDQLHSSRGNLGSTGKYVQSFLYYPHVLCQ
jgi:hypothetical protein